MDKISILAKLKTARGVIKGSNLKKAGENTYSKFKYYTPEQVEQLVDKACEETNTIVLCNLKGDENGLFQTLTFIDLDNGDELSFEMRTKHGSITATNETQQMGGTDTYSERYIKMKVFQIKDNNLDFDSTSGKPEKKVDKPVRALDDKKNATKAEIKKLADELEPLLSTATEYADFIRKKTGLELSTDNYQEIIDRLTVLVGEIGNKV